MTRNGFSDNIAKCCAGQLADRTANQYSRPIKGWIKFNELKHWNQYEFDPHKLMEYIVDLSENQEKKLPEIKFHFKVLRSLGSYIGKPLNKDQIRPFEMIFASIFKRNPIPVNHNQETWDVRLYLDFLKRNAQNEDLTLKDLGCKLATLLLVVTSRRPSDIINLDINRMSWSSDKSQVTFTLTGQKTSSHRTKKSVLQQLHTIQIEKLPQGYEHAQAVCPVRCLENYLHRTQHVRQGTTQLLISCMDPFKAVAPGTLYRWVGEELEKAGVDTKSFTAKSIRGASTSAVFASGHVSIPQILKRVCWRSADTFTKHYLRHVPPAIETEKEESMSTAVPPPQMKELAYTLPSSLAYQWRNEITKNQKAKRYEAFWKDTNTSLIRQADLNRLHTQAETVTKMMGPIVKEHTYSLASVQANLMISKGKVAKSKVARLQKLWQEGNKKIHLGTV